MVKVRDDFNLKTKETLAKRVGYLCSNPNCKKPTIGPNLDPEKSLSIGKAAHITAASPNGPRYNNNLTRIERKHISNGIWLCSNCADLIDKDQNRFTVELITKWKNDTENELLLKLTGNYLEIERPNIDIDLIWNSALRSNKGLSMYKNKIEYINGNTAFVNKTNPPINLWEISWEMQLVIFNNSSYPIFNVSIETLGKNQFSLEKISKVNNIPPLKHIDLKAKFIDFIESSYIDADKLLNQRVPKKLNHQKFIIKYYNERRVEFTDEFIIKDLLLVKHK